jgi:hypothetical protein
MCLLLPPARPQEVLGIWKMNPSRSTFSGDPHAKALTVRIERHAKGEVITFERIRADGQAVTVSMVLYFDGRERAFQGEACFGSQSSRRLDDRTVQVLLKCRGWSAQLTRRSMSSPNDLMLDVTRQQADGQRSKHSLILEKH